MGSQEFERGPRSFRGYNGVWVDRYDLPKLFVDTIDVGLFGQSETSQSLHRSPISYSANEPLWSSLLSHKIGQGDTIRLEGFQLLEWLPAAPGRYFTPEGVRQRSQAEQYWDRSRSEFLPLGKDRMVLGGVGSVRLAPRIVRGGEVCFFGASSNAISHQGIPVVVPLDEGRPVLQEIQSKGCVSVDLTGTLWPLPAERSPVKFDRGIPKYYLFAESVDRQTIGGDNEPLVTVAITFSSDHNGQWLPIDELKVNPTKNWSFASFNPAHGHQALGEAVDWLKEYAAHYAIVRQDGTSEPSPPEYLSILGDFDELETHFDNPIDFPLRGILSGQFDPRLLDLYGALFHITVNKEIVMGDKFENIRHSTIINRSIVEDAVKNTRLTMGADTAELLSGIADVVDKSQNSAAVSLLNSLMTELKQKQPDKSKVRQIWDGLVDVLPDIATIAGASAKIAGLFS